MKTADMKRKVARIFGDSPMGMEEALDWAIEGIREPGRTLRDRWSASRWDARIVDGIAGVVVENTSVSYCAQIAVKQGVAKVAAFFDTDRIDEDGLSDAEVRLHVSID